MFLKKNSVTLLMGSAMAMSAFSQDYDRLKISYVGLDKGSAQPVKSFPVKVFDGELRYQNKIEVMPDFTFQTIEGIGGAFNEIGGEALMSLAPEQQADVMNRLFADESAGFTYCRTAIGASDFSNGAYSYSETPEDFEMAHFSVERDQQYVLPYIKAALQVNPDLKLFASPWSPPAWMKQSGEMAGINELGTLREEKRVFEAYGKYFANYVQAYKQNGVNIRLVCVQNEPDASTKYTSNIMPADQMLDLAINYIRPEFKKNGIDTKIFAGTFRSHGNMEMHRFVALDQAKKVDGIGVQYTDPRLVQEVQRKYPGFTFMHTESACFQGANSPKEAVGRLGEVSGMLDAGCVNFCYWNMILNETGLSHWDWKQNSLINIDREKKTVRYNPDYNVMYLISKMVKPGDVRVASSFLAGPIISVKDKAGTLKVIIQNETRREQGIRMRVDDDIFHFMIPARAVSAIEIGK
ncbi:glycoside hydrolase family 30 protein [Pontiella agarivorans]|uniref:Glycosyl hydrolase family 30 TIM-barrel domain-containing protein n=1 Tax=Pontiella agarivorans TaxID=3038953 RepID=A0ABU5MY18_9BACT|nr:hypothetical protein [Pontiella agarivorans]MDZ8119072.1 hypothetical protein [Pontiella agarivorans]